MTTRVRRRVVAVGIVALVGFSAMVAARSTGDDGATAQERPSATAPVVRTDITQREELDGTLGYAALDAPLVAGRAGTLTALAPEGSTVDRGQPVFAVDGSPVVLLVGVTPAYRDLVEGMSGADVRQLKENLVGLGHGTWASVGDDDRFTAGTAAALRVLQRQIGARPTGVLRDGDAVFVPQPVRVADHRATVGAAVTTGTEIATVSSTERVVTIELEASKQDRVQVGDAVTVEFPSGARVDAHVRDVASVAEAGGENGEDDTPTIAVTVTLDDPATAGSLDQAPVDVSIVTATADDVLAVPVSALLALAEGGYGVEIVERGGRHRVVAVETGMFSDSEDLVEIRGDGVAEGDTVAMPR